MVDLPHKMKTSIKIQMSKFENRKRILSFIFRINFIVSVHDLTQYPRLLKRVLDSEIELHKADKMNDNLRCKLSKKTEEVVAARKEIIRLNEQLSELNSKLEEPSVYSESLKVCSLYLVVFALHNKNMVLWSFEEIYVHYFVL